MIKHTQPPPFKPEHARNLLLWRVRCRYFALPASERPDDVHALLTPEEARLLAPLTRRQQLYVTTASARRVRQILRLLAKRLFPRRGERRRTEP